MKNRHLYKTFLAAALVGVSLAFSSCGKDDDSSSSNTNGNSQEQTGDSEEKLVSELKCTVAEFATKYTTLKKGEKVSVTLTDVSDNNLPQVAAVLQKMSGTKLSKAGSEGYIVVLVLESKDDLKKIPAEIFKDCSAIATITIPDCVELIESGAFDGCTALEAVKILSEIVEIQEGAFAENIKVEKPGNEVVVKPEIKLLSPADIVDYVNASDEEVVTLEMPLDTYDHTEVLMAIDKITDKKVKLVIPEGVEELTLLKEKLPMNDFNYPIFPRPKALKEVVIPEGVTVIGEIAFSDCNNLVSISIPSTVKEIGSGAFAFCSSLVGLTIPESVSKIGSEAFTFCQALTSITIPESVDRIESATFNYCSKLSSITIPKSVNVIGSGAFFGCNALSSITIPESITEIASEVFVECTSLTSITIPGNVKKIGAAAFRHCTALTSITIPESVNEIGTGAFYNCSALTSITIPEGVKEIGDYVFSRCSNLTSITIPDGVTKIGKNSFEYCSSLTQIDIPGSVTRIGTYSFDSCDNLENIYCSKAIYYKYHEDYPKMVVKDSYSKAEYNCIKFNIPELRSARWDSQFWIKSDKEHRFNKGDHFKFSCFVKADSEFTIKTSIHGEADGSSYMDMSSDIMVSTDWQYYEVNGIFDKDYDRYNATYNSFALDLSGDVSRIFYFADISLLINGEEVIKNGDLTNNDFSSFRWRIDNVFDTPSLTTEKQTIIIK